MKRIIGTLAAVLATSLVACGSDTVDAIDAGATGGFTQPAGTVVVNFTVDDSVNKDWKAGELEWKGQVQFTPATRIAKFNSDWLAQDPGWAPLYDDGPWNVGTPPGHEPLGATAGDHKWGVAVFVTPPATGGADIVAQYGLRDATNTDRANGGWVWLATDPGSFTIKATTTGAVNAPGQTFPTKGNIDLKLVINKNGLAASQPPFTTNAIKVKGSAWGWVEKATFDDGMAVHGDDTSADGKFTFLLSQNISATAPPYPGLLKSGDKPEFVFVLDGVEYKVGADASTTGVTAAWKKPTDAAFTAVTVGTVTGGLGGKNTSVTIP